MKKVTVERPKISLVTCLGSLAVIVALAVVLVVLIQISFPETARQPAPTQFFTVIPAPSLTSPVIVPSLPPGQEAATPTPTAVPAGEMGIGAYVQIYGTSGDGLRLRSGPSTDDPPLFLGKESEVFQIKDGPRQSGGFTWWFLVAPYDASREGWAVQNYLSVVNVQPTP